MKDILRKLTKYKVIKVTKQIARSKFYRLNENSKLLPHLRGLIQDFGIQRSTEIAKEETIDKKSEEGLNSEEKTELI